jgi:hypothetical protein
MPRAAPLETSSFDSMSLYSEESSSCSLGSQVSTYRTDSLTTLNAARIGDATNGRHPDERLLAASSTGGLMCGRFDYCEPDDKPSSEGKQEYNSFYLDDSGAHQDDYYDVLFSKPSPANEHDTLSCQETPNFGNDSSACFLDEESITTPANVPVTPSMGLFRPKSRAQQQRCQKRTYQIGFMAVILVLILSVTLGVTIGHHSTNQQQQVATGQPAATSPPEGAPPMTQTSAPSNSTIIPDVTDGEDTSGQLAQVHAAESTATAAQGYSADTILAQTRPPASNRPVRMRHLV